MDTQQTQEFNGVLKSLSRGIRTHMNDVLGIVELGKRNLKDPAVLADCFNRLEQSSRSFLTVSVNLLENARIDKEDLQLNEEPLECHSFFRECVGEFRAAHPRVDLSLVVKPKAGIVLADREVLQRIFNGILEYAAVREAEHVEVRLEEGNSGMWNYRLFLLTVTDDGRSYEGPEAFLMDCTEDQAVAGLGMQMSERLVRFLDGSIRHELLANQNTQVKLELILQSLKGGAQAPEAEREEKELRPLNPEGLKVLVVEDNDLNREIITELLMAEGMETDGAVNGLEAVATVQEKGTDYYDFILMDLQMPVMDGYEAALRLRNLPGGDEDQLVIIAMTADTMSEDRQKSKQVGMNAYLSKPLEMPKLLNILRTSLKEVGGNEY